MPESQVVNEAVGALREAVPDATLVGCTCCEGVGADYHCDEQHQDAGRSAEHGWPCIPCRGQGQVLALEPHVTLGHLRVILEVLEARRVALTRLCVAIETYRLEHQRGDRQVEARHALFATLVEVNEMRARA